jgi:purine-binding chemotaxis protein CheW
MALAWHTTRTGASASHPAAGPSYVTLHLGQEHYAIPAARIRGVMRLQDFTPGADASFIRGVVDIRGRAIPLIDLRNKLGLPAVDPGPKTSVVLTDLPTLRGIQCIRVGLMVDRVSQLFHLAGNLERLSHPDGPEMEPAWILGVTKVKRRQKAVIDIDQLFTESDMVQLIRAAT